MSNSSAGGGFVPTRSTSESPAEAKIDTTNSPLRLRGGITFGHVILFEGDDYIGSAVNLASRLCDEAKANQIVVSRRVYGMVEPWVEGRPIDDLSLKGFNHPILAAEILSWREEVDNVVDAASAAARMKKKS